MPKSKGRAKKRRSASSRARRASIANEHVAAKRSSHHSRRRRRLAGWSLIAFGVVVGVTHLMEHGGLFQLAPSGVEDLLMGYPMAMLLAVLGLAQLPA